MAANRYSTLRFVYVCEFCWKSCCENAS